MTEYQDIALKTADGRTIYSAIQEMIKNNPVEKC